jgi:outer membrane protein OmpA-like peptidoglycan-associated protein
MSDFFRNVRRAAPAIISASGFLLLAGCGQMNPPPPPAVAYNPPSAAVAALPPSEVNRFHVGFATGSAQIGPNGQSAINGAAAVLQANPAMVATLIGSADNDGRDQANMRLSQQRARAVHNALLRTGTVRENQLDTHWVGERRAGPNPGASVAGVSDRSVEIAIH